MPPHDHHHDHAAEHTHADAHGHGHAGGHDHGHSHGFSSGTRAFAIATLINLAYTALEAGFGFYTDSLALLSDALHNFGDVLGLALAWGAATMAKRAPTGRHTYGWRRATLLSPLGNALLLVGFSGALGWEAVRRFADPPQIPALPVIIVAAIGIAVNLGAAWFVRDGHGGHSHSQDLNRRGAFLHLVADAAVSLAAVLAGFGMLWLDWRWLDPATAVLVAVVVALGAFRLPRGIDQDEVQAFLSDQPGVQAVHHLHIWSLGAGEIALTAHLVRPGSEDQHTASDHDTFLDTLVHALNDRFGINHPTLQIEHGQACDHDRHDRAPHGSAPSGSAPSGSGPHLDGPHANH
jgi:cobalt-zinc-cadmium efflux system protein